MHIFKQLFCTTFIISAAALCSADQSPLKQTTPELHESRINAGIIELNKKYHELSDALKVSHAQQEQFGKQFNETLKKATKKSWPISARLITLGLVAWIAWDHKNVIREHADAVGSHIESAGHILFQAVANKLKTTRETFQRIKEAVQQPKNAPHENAETPAPLNDYEANQRED